MSATWETFVSHNREDTDIVVNRLLARFGGDGVPGTRLGPTTWDEATWADATEDVNLTELSEQVDALHYKLDLMAEQIERLGHAPRWRGRHV